MNEEVLARVDALAAKLGVAAEHLWSVLIRQAYVELAETVLYGLLLTVVWVAFRKCLRGLNESDYETETLYMGGTLVFGIVGAICTIIWSVSFVDAIGAALNPEMYAFREIAQLFGP